MKRIIFHTYHIISWEIESYNLYRRVPRWLHDLRMKIKYYILIILSIEMKSGLRKSCPLVLGLIHMGLLMGLTFDFEVRLGSSGYSPFGPQIYPIKTRIILNISIKIKLCI